MHVKIDTGMGRLGVWHEEAPAVFRAIAAEPGVVLAGICTHFASSDDDPGFTARQREIFLETIGKCTGLSAHVVGRTWAESPCYFNPCGQ